EVIPVDNVSTAIDTEDYGMSLLEEIAEVSRRRAQLLFEKFPVGNVLSDDADILQFSFVTKHRCKIDLQEHTCTERSSIVGKALDGLLLPLDCLKDIVDDWASGITHNFAEIIPFSKWSFRD